MTKKTVKTDAKPLKSKVLKYYADRGMGKKKIDEEKLYLLAQSMLPIETIAIIMDCNAQLLYEKHAEVLHAGRADRKKDLVASMWYNAIEKKNVQMQIWMSKQHLGYKDQIPEVHQHNVFNLVVSDVPIAPQSPVIEVSACKSLE